MKRIVIALCLLVTIAVAVYAMQPMAVTGGSPEAAGGASEMRVDNFTYANIAPLFAGGDLYQFIQPTHGFRATNATTSLYPWAWRGLVAAHAPGLGNTGGTLRDVSGFRRDGTINGATWVGSQYGYALNFVAASSQYAEIPVGNYTSNQIGSVVVNIIPASLSAISAIFSLADSALPDRWGLLIRHGAAGNLEVLIRDGATGWLIIQDSDIVPLAVGRQSTISITQDGSAYKAYVDGVQLAMSDAYSQTSTDLGAWFGSIGTQLDRLRLGYAADSTPSDPFNGKILGVRIYNIALSASEVQQDFQNFKRKQTYLARR